MHRRIEHIAAELLICQSPASNSNYIFSAVFTYFLGGFLRKKRWLLGLRPRPGWGSLQRSPTPPSWAGGVPPSRTLPGAAPPTTSPHPSPHPRRCPPPLPIPGSATEYMHKAYACSDTLFNSYDQRFTLFGSGLSTRTIILKIHLCDYWPRLFQAHSTLDNKTYALKY